MGDFRLGAVAVIDALGFKGIWQKHSLSSVLQTLRRVRTTALSWSNLRTHFGDQSLPETYATLFSDTVAVVTLVEESSEPKAAQTKAVRHLAQTVAAVVAGAAENDVPLVYRGTIAVGQCFVDPDDLIIIGEAVDEAAALMNRADGAFIWLSPNAATWVSLDEADRVIEIWDRLLPRYSVPLKDGRTVATRVVNPFFHLRGADTDMEKIELTYRRFMESPELDVALKWQNTKAFLQHLRSIERMREISGSAESKD